MDSTDQSQRTAHVGRRTFLGTLVLGAILGGGLATMGLVYGKAAAEKLATALVMPLGLLWLFLWFALIWGWSHRNRGLMITSLIALVFIWLGGSRFIADRLMASLESSVDWKYFETVDPLDTVVVLGGGTSIQPYGGPELREAGDRVRVAAALYHAGKVQKIVVTGTKLATDRDYDPKMDDPAEQAEAILIQLRVPAEDIIQITGRNTSEEIQSIVNRPELSKDKTIGLITSAWHMPRALRLAQRHQLNMVPIGADFRGNRHRPWFATDCVPESHALSDMTVLIKEHLGKALGR